jgi:hypothetical protein
MEAGNNSPQIQARAKRVLSSLIILLAILAGFYINQQQENHPKEAPPTVEGQQVSAVNDQFSKHYATALAGLNALAVKGRAPKTGYTRTQFGDGWAKTDGCDTRNHILARDLTDTLYEPGGCLVSSGVLQDPYTNKQIRFVRGQSSSAVQIDHVVALSDSWQKGAQLLSPELREQMANDPLELLAVDGPANHNKGDGDAATWLPPNKAFRCSYVARQVSVKLKYSLWITTAEKDAITTILKNCPNQTLAS